MLQDMKEQNTAAALPPLICSFASVVSVAWGQPHLEVDDLPGLSSEGQ